MDAVNKTLYIPLYGKAVVSRRGLFLSDKKAEEIWNQEQFALKGKSASKWLAYYMGIRSAVFDDWLRAEMDTWTDAAVLHIGCGLDSRALRVGTRGHKWFDVDFPEVIRERSRYFTQTQEYRMLPGDIRESGWMDALPADGSAIVVMEGVSMYLTPEELQTFVRRLAARFERIHLLMDCYTELAARASRYKNPIRDVGVTQVYGLNQPEELDHGTFRFTRELEMTPVQYIRQLQGVERCIFRRVFGGKLARKLYRLYVFQTG